MRAITCRTASSLVASAAAGLATLLVAAPATAQTYDASADFDVTSNPSTVNGGAFSYGYETSLGSAFTLYPMTTTGQGYNDANIKGWTKAGGFPFVIQNTSNSSQVINGTGITLAAKQLAVHPSSAAELSVIRFTVPATDTYSLTSAFTALDSGGTDVHVLLNNVSLFSAQIAGTGNSQSFNPAAQTLTAGSFVDFAVGVGADGGFTSDTTSPSITFRRNSVVAATPEPGSFALFIGMAISTGAFLKRRRK